MSVAKCTTLTFEEECDYLVAQLVEAKALNVMEAS
jgi:hypothetical protein